MSSSDTKPTIMEEVAHDVAILRRSFRTGKTIPISSREASLRSLRRMLTENAKLICSAGKQDLRKPEFEATNTAIALVLKDVQIHLDNMYEWSSPKTVSTDLLNLPGKSAIISEPLGVCCIIGGWNVLFNSTFLPLIGCLSAGNTCLIRVPPPEWCPESSKVLAMLVKKYLDDDIVRVVQGGYDATDAVLAQKFDKIFFTGGIFVGKMVARAAAENLCPVVLELGGMNPCIVEESADLQVAARRVAWGAFMNAGQICIRPDHIFVHASIADRFIEMLKECVRSMFGEDNQKSPDYGRIVNVRNHKRLVGLIGSSQQHIVHGGNSDEADKYIEPTIMDFGTDQTVFEASPVMEAETFGPILPILRYESLDQVLEFIKHRPKPLVVHCFTNKMAVHQRVLRDTSSGAFVVNDAVVQKSNLDLPFGGVGMSGYGSYHGKFSFDAFSHQKSILYKTNYLDVPQRYPPYTPFGVKLLEIILTPWPRWQSNLMKVCFSCLAFGLLTMQVHWPTVKEQFVNWATEL